MLIKFAPLQLQVPWLEGFSQCQEDQKVKFLNRVGKSFFKLVTHTCKEENKINLDTVRMHTRNKQSLPTTNFHERKALAFSLQE